MEEDLRSLSASRWTSTNSEDTSWSIEKSCPQASGTTSSRRTLRLSRPWSRTRPASVPVREEYERDWPRGRCSDRLSSILVDGTTEKSDRLWESAETEGSESSRISFEVNPAVSKNTGQRWSGTNACNSWPICDDCRQGDLDTERERAGVDGPVAASADHFSSISLITSDRCWHNQIRSQTSRKIIQTSMLTSPGKSLWSTA